MYLPEVSVSYTMDTRLPRLADVAMQQLHERIPEFERFMLERNKMTVKMMHFGR